MKNFGLMALALVMTLALAPIASAQQGLYFTPKVGFSSATVDVDRPGASSETKRLVPFGLAVGYDLNPAMGVPVRAEFEYVFRGKTKFYDDGAITKNSPEIKAGAQTFFVNAYYDIELSAPVTPYVGFGLGMASLTIDNGDSQSETGFAWNIGLGAAYKLTDLMTLDLGYRYADFGKPEFEFGQKTDVKANAHEMLLGLRFTL